MKKDLGSQIFGRLLVLRDSGKRSKGRSVMWLCQCGCGNRTLVQTSHLKFGKVRSCGCLRKELLRKRLLKHNGCGSRLYRIWGKMRDRCYNPNSTAYKYYGQRGIKICPTWKDDFNAFRFWAFRNKYNDDLTIDRIDNDGSYSPSNCRWITQSANTGRRWNL